MGPMPGVSLDRRLMSLVDDEDDDLVKPRRFFLSLSFLQRRTVPPKAARRRFGISRPFCDPRPSAPCRIACAYVRINSFPAHSLFFVGAKMLCRRGAARGNAKGTRAKSFCWTCSCRLPIWRTGLAYHAALEVQRRTSAAAHPNSSSFASAPLLRALPACCPLVWQLDGARPRWRA